jgi:hypothetical protein
MPKRIVVPLVLAASLVLGLVVGAALPGQTTSVASPGGSTPPPPGSAAPDTSTPAGSGTPSASTGRNIENYPITKLAKGEQPPQFVVLSFDGSCDHDLMQHYMNLGDSTNSRFTFFLSGLCLVPDKDHNDYHPPGKPVGTSAIGFGDPTKTNNRVKDWSEAYDKGYDIGTHFLGHFCDSNGVGTWSKKDWQSELSQAQHFLDDWKQVNADNKHADLSLNFSFKSSDWTGDRTPCLAGRRDQMYPVFEKAGFAYDASSTGTLSWPQKVSGYSMWNFPLQTIKIEDWPGNRHQLSMDYNFLYTQNAGKVDAPQAKCDKIQQSAYASFQAALKAVYDGNRAPLIIGNHFNSWVCGAYVNALTKFVQDANAQDPDVQFVSFDYLAQWLDAQDPKVLKKLQARGTQQY